MSDALVKVTIEIVPTNEAITAIQQTGGTPPTSYKKEFAMNVNREHLPIRFSLHSVAKGADERPLLESSQVCKD